jgi:hypothetical protein
MAAEKETKPAPREAMEPQDQSIKARKRQLFEEPQTDSAPTIKTFDAYLRETPPFGLSPGVKAALWVVGVLVVLLFLLALFGPRRLHRAKPTAWIEPQPAARVADAARA